MTTDRPLEVGGVQHHPRCAIFHTPPFTVIRSACNCQEPRYFVDTEHVRGERRTYWVADKHQTVRGFPGRKVGDYTYDRRKAERDCLRMNGGITYCI